MTLFAFNVALAATLTALAALIAERLCLRRAVALRHGLLFVCLLVIAAAPMLACVAHLTGVGLLRTAPPPAPARSVQQSPPLAVERNITKASPAPSHEVHPVRAPAQHVGATRWMAEAIPLAAGILIAIWALGSLFHLSRLIRSWTFLRRLAHSAEKVGGDVRQLTLAAARRLGLRRIPQVSWCAPAPTPLVMGLLRPRVLLPLASAALSVDELEAVLLHELAHVARRDQWAGLLASIVRALFWWCVPVGILIRRLGDWREQLCDAQVVRCQGHGLNLATALLSVCEWSLRGRPAFAAAAALGAAGSSGRALRNRIQTLTNQEKLPMTHTNYATRVALVGLGLLIAGTVTVVSVRAKEAAPDKGAPALTATEKMLTAPDFWQKTGAATKHDFDKATIAELEKIAEASDHPERCMRATKLLDDLEGRCRMNPKFSDAENTMALAAAFEYLETHLGDPEIVKYAPERGFSHMTLSEKAGDTGAIWVLIETVPPVFSGGLNIRVDIKTQAVTEVKQWGAIRKPAAGK